jgi:hypothetical protein
LSKKSSGYSCVLRSMSTDPSESFTSVSESNTSNCVCVCILIVFVFHSFAYMRMDWSALAYIKFDLNKKRFMQNLISSRKLIIPSLKLYLRPS